MVLSRDAQTALLASIIAGGDEKALETMINAIVGKSVAKFLANYPRYKHLSHDMHGAGALALVEALHKIAAGRVKNPSSYIRRWVDRAVRSTPDCHLGIGAAPRTIRKHRKEGRVLPRHVPHVDDSSVPAEGGCASDLREEIQSICKTNEEKQLVEMLEQGYDIKEIAETLGVSRSTIYARRKRLFQRWQKKNKEDDR